MISKRTWISAALVATTAAGSATAEEIGTAGSMGTPESDSALAPGKRLGPGSVVLAADRLFGVHMWKVKSSGGGVDSQEKGTEVDLLLAGRGTTPGQVPRLAFDWVGTHGVSLGGAIGYTSETTSRKTNGATADGPKSSLFLFAPRLGYLMTMGPKSAFWPRAGVTWYSQKTDVQTTGTQVETFTTTGLQANVEAMFFLGLTPSLGFLVGPFYDLSLSGKRKVEGPRAAPEVDVKPSDLGLAVGVAGGF